MSKEIIIELIGRITSQEDLLLVYAFLLQLVKDE